MEKIWTNNHHSVAFDGVVSRDTKMIISEIDKPMLGALLSLSAGALIYVGATHLLPKAEQEHKRYSFVALGGGVLVAVIIVLSKA